MEILVWRPGSSRQRRRCSRSRPRWRPSLRPMTGSRRCSAQVPLLRRVVAQAKEKGSITVDQLNAALPAGLSAGADRRGDPAAGIARRRRRSRRCDVGRAIRPSRSEAARPSLRPRRASEGEEAAPAAGEEEELGRTDDPVRMYLREMGTIELLSREGEIEIAKRIEAGRNMVLEALCESPLTMRAVIGWRDAIREGRVLLRDIIDLDATYEQGPGGPPELAERGSRRGGRRRARGRRRLGRAEDGRGARPPARPRSPRRRISTRTRCRWRPSRTSCRDGVLDDLRRDRRGLRRAARAAGGAPGRDPGQHQAVDAELGRPLPGGPARPWSS